MCKTRNQFNDRAEQHLNLHSTNLHDAQLVGARLERAFLVDARLERANLRDARLEGANLGGARLEWAFLGGARLERANLGGARLEGAFLGGARLEGAIDLTVEQLATVKTLYQARLDSPLLEQIQQHYPYLLEAPKD